MSNIAQKVTFFYLLLHQFPQRYLSYQNCRHPFIHLIRERSFLKMFYIQVNTWKFIYLNCREWYEIAMFCWIQRAGKQEWLASDRFPCLLGDLVLILIGYTLKGLGEVPWTELNIMAWMQTSDLSEKSTAQTIRPSHLLRWYCLCSVAYIRVRTGHRKPGKSWNLWISFPGLEIHGIYYNCQSLKVMEY